MPKFDGLIIADSRRKGNRELCRRAKILLKRVAPLAAAAWAVSFVDIVDFLCYTMSTM
jgi:hypothetical protein